MDELATYTIRNAAGFAVFTTDDPQEAILEAERLEAESEGTLGYEGFDGPQALRAELDTRAQTEDAATQFLAQREAEADEALLEQLARIPPARIAAAIDTKGKRKRAGRSS